MNKLVSFLHAAPAGIFLFAAFLIACSDDVENTTINQSGVELYDSSDDLPKCTDKNEGELAFVMGESSARICVDGGWIPLVADGSGAAEFSCKTEELKDKSGLKIVCNGDSIGVVLNGEDGERGDDGKDGKEGKPGESGADGKDGADCKISGRIDSVVVVACGDSVFTIDLYYESMRPDSESIPVSFDSLVGFTQKGPFYKGSTVFLYELSDGRTLKQTNGNFTSSILSDDGRYVFSARDLVSQYAMVVVYGYFRNEVTGKASSAPIRLKALTDMRKRSSVNVNVLTHLELERIYHLVTRGDSTGKKLTVKQAKRQAQREILGLFHMELDEQTDAEDMDVFGEGDADAALLAVSVLLQLDTSEAALTQLLTEISNDVADYGVWKDAAGRARIADWATSMDLSGKLDSIRRHVESWGLGNGEVPDFEKFIRRFWSVENKLGVCGDSENPVGTIKSVSNSHSGKYYAEPYADTSITKVRFFCDTGSVGWRLASDIEKDTLGWGQASEGDFRNGQINKGETYVFQDNHWRLGTEMDSLLNQACMEDGQISNSTYQDYYYRCLSYSWGVSFRWSRLSVSENDTYEHWDECKAGGAYADGRFLTGRVTGKIYVCDNGKFRLATDQEKTFGKGCTSYNEGDLMKVGESEYAEYGYPCGTGSSIGSYMSIRRNESKYGKVTDPRDGKQYYTIEIDSKTWMAENLNFEYKVGGSTYGNYCYTDNCKAYGRFYTWAAAMDSAGVYLTNGKGCGEDKSCSPTYPVRGVCFAGWHLPSKEEWTKLYSEMGNKAYAMQAIGFEEWPDATDAYGFSIIPAGEMFKLDDFIREGIEANFWSSTDAIGWTVRATYGTLYGNYSHVGYSVRCVKD